MIKKLLFGLAAISLLGLAVVSFFPALTADEVINATNGTTSWGISELRTFGNVYIVDSGNSLANNNNSGTEADKPLATIAGAISKCTSGQGDIIYVLPGHTETVTTAITVNKTGVSIVGIGTGELRPTITVSGAIDGFDITAAYVTIKNIVVTTTGSTAGVLINVGAADAQIRNVKFIQAAAALYAITIPAAGDYCIIEDNDFQVTANGPTAGIGIESATAIGIQVKNNLFHTASVANPYDEAAIISNVANTDCLIEGNSIYNAGAAIDLNAASTGLIKLNYMAGGTLGSMLDPGSCFCFENYEADDIDESGRLFPTTTAQ
jgi:hypothetical protein